MTLGWTIPPSTSPRPSRLPAPRQVLGRDVRFSADFEVTPAGDWATVEGEAALKQALLRRLTTTPGEFALRPAYGAGLGDAVKSRASRKNIDGLRSQIEEQLLADPRVESVEAVTVEPRVVHGQPVIRVAVALTSAGQGVRLGPLDFAEEV